MNSMQVYQDEILILGAGTNVILSDYYKTIVQFILKNIKMAIVSQ